MAIACGSTTAVAVHYDWPKAYWLVMTLAIVLRPYAAESLEQEPPARDRNPGRGDLGRCCYRPLPRPVLLLSAAVCMALTVGVPAGEELRPAGHVHDADGDLPDFVGLSRPTPCPWMRFGSSTPWQRRYVGGLVSLALVRQADDDTAAVP
ncbi:MAG: hypothetical protein V9G09_04735 [Candidatus Nanopelagicales bacterium]